MTLSYIYKYFIYSDMNESEWFSAAAALYVKELQHLEPWISNIKNRISSASRYE